MAVLQPIIIKIDTVSEAQTSLSYPEDYIIDYKNGEIITKTDLKKDERLIARNYSIDYDVNKFITMTRAFLGDLKRDDRIYQNQELLDYAVNAMIINNPKYDWDFYMDKNGAIRSYSSKVVISDKNMNLIAAYTSLEALEATIQEALRNAILLQEGKTKLDTTKGPGLQIAYLEKRKAKIEQRIYDDALDSITGNLDFAVTSY